MITMKGQHNSANIFIDEIDDTTREQIQEFLNHPAFHGGYIAIMPDCHAGVGAVIGFTMKMNGYVLPTIVGVDIGCGVLAARVEIQDIDLPALDKFIRAEIPAGFHIHEKPVGTFLGGAELADVCEAIGYDRTKALRSIGTLGGGNHFIEVDRDEKTGALWLVVHSGSRNFGLSVANFYQRKAKEGLEAYFIRDQYKGLEFIPPGNPAAGAYLRAMQVAQDFASLNRLMIMRKLFAFVGSGELFPMIESVHNYIDLDAGIIRKGAIAANAGQACIIPFNMRDGVAICRGKGSAKHNYSAPHGAGRSLSRKKAKATLSLKEFTEGMAEAGVYTTTATADTLDEAPGAYKPMDTILENIEETVEVVTMLKPIYNFKASDK
jgi:RNA-splicing ligase RtcB